MPEELELKLVLSPEAMAKLPRHPLVRALATGRKRKTRVVSTYYDTPALTLMETGAALRLRRMGNRRFQAFKTVVAGTGGQRQREFEVEVADDALDLDKFGPGTLDDLLPCRQPNGGFQPVFTTDFERRRVTLRLVESDIELAMDSGSIVADGRKRPICEAELELKSGRAKRLYELALALAQTVPFRLETRSKAERGYDLALETHPKPVKAECPALTQAMGVGVAFATLLRSGLEHLRSNDAAVLDCTDPEAVHQMRVATRRLRALLGLFPAVLSPEALAHLKEELRWLQRRLGPARDWDVFISETLQPVADANAGSNSLAALVSGARAARDAAYATAHDTLLDPRFTRLLLTLDLWLEENGWAAAQPPAGKKKPDADILGFAKRALARQDKKLAKLGANYLRRTNDELHRIRIQAKKLRYTAEFLASLYPAKPTRKLIARAAQLQDTLGSLNDAVIGEQLLAELKPRMVDEPGGDAAFAEATDLIRAWQKAPIADDRKSFEATWRAYRKAPRFWK